MESKLINTNVLAYLGDGVFEVYVRRHLIKQGIVKPNLLQAEAIKFVSAKAQATFIRSVIENDLFTDEEMHMYKRARNTKTKSIAKHTDVITYKMATGFEAVIGMLDIQNQHDRIGEIFEMYVSSLEQI